PDNPPGAQSPRDPLCPAGLSAPPDAGAAQTQGAPPILDDTPAAELPDADVPASPGSPDVNVEAELKDGAVPAASGGRAWSLVNLALTCVAALLLVLSPARYFLAAIGRRGGEEDASPGGTEDPRAEAAGRAAARRARRGRALLAGILSTVVTILLFLLTEDMRLPMEWVNKYTVVYAAAVAAELFFALSAKRRPKARPAE
ncbi:MAG: hypothetical protein LBO81_07145, partial [Clostridiales Family XIII bacterium]|nr:hypothetical protein [Clostridiales Family XIII bacterium]